MDDILSIGKACCGCGLCASICPKGAIIMQPSDIDGCIYPLIDQEKCIHCGLCLGKCPITAASNGNSPVRPLQTIAVAAKSDNIRQSSASGGFMTTLSKWIIANGGIVAGAAYSRDFVEVEHILAETERELALLQGSKYVQSKIKPEIFRKIKQAAEQGRWVLFTGTHCQAAALNSYLNGKRYNKLIIADVLCHGVPSPLAWKKYIDYQKQEHSCREILSVNMKEKAKSWNNSAMKIEFRDHVYCAEHDYWKMAFAADLMLRESCHDCKFKRGNGYSVSDITAGDFWGGDAYDFEPVGKGLSFVMLNTQMGQKVWQQIKEQLNEKPITYEMVLKGNPMLENSAPRNGHREEVFRMLKKYPFDYMIQCVFAHDSILKCHIRRIKKKVKAILKGST